MIGGGYEEGVMVVVVKVVKEEGLEFKSLLFTTL